MVSLIAKIANIKDSKYAIVIDMENTQDELEFVAKLDNLLNEYGKKANIVEVKEIEEVFEDE